MNKFCGYCGAHLDESSGLCPKCDAQMIKNTKQTSKLSNVQKDKKQPLRLRRLKSGIVALLAVLIVLCVVVIALSNRVPIFTNIGEDGKYKPSSISDTDLSWIEGDYETPEEHIVYAPHLSIQYADNEILVNLTSNEVIDEFLRFINSSQLQIADSIPSINHYRLLTNTSNTLNQLKEKCNILKNQSFVSYACVNYYHDVEESYVPNDKEWPKLAWYLKDSKKVWGVKSIEADKAWDYRDQMQKVNIGVIDAMFDVSHEDLIFAEKPMYNDEALKK